MKIKRFDKFAGVDFSCDPGAVDNTRSPDAVNIMPDASGLPEKRIGYRKIGTFDGKINGIFAFNDEILVHAGDKIYKDGAPIMSQLNDGKSTSCAFCGKLWILTGEEFLVYDGESIKNVREVATVPQVLSQTDNYLKNGFTYQPFNLLTGRRCVGVTVSENGTNVIYINQRADKDTVKVYYRDSGKEIAVKKCHEIEWTSDKPQLCVEFYEGLSQVGVPDGVMIEYDMVEEKERIIEKCTFIASYDNRLFVGGNPNYPDADFYSQLNDGTYFADINYTNIGTASESRDGEFEKLGTGGSRILGYSYVGDYLAVHKNGDGEGATLYLRHAKSTEDGTIYPIVEGIAGEAILTHFSCNTLLDDPLFLTKSGIMAIGSHQVRTERCLRARSSRINPRLCKEEKPEAAVSCVWRGFYLIFINGNVYLADSRGRKYNRSLSGDFEYEWYYWQNVPARVVCADGDDLYFGDGEGNLYRFNSDIKDMTAYNDDGKPILARWSTKMDDDGNFGVKKHLMRRGSGVYLKSYSASNVTLKARTERDFGTEVARKNAGIFSFSDMNFKNFTFNTLPFSFMPFGRKIKNYRMLQVIVENNEVNQSMGIVAIELRFERGDYMKGV